MTDRWERLTDLYHAAVALPEDERASLLTEACADDPALQADVQRLVAAHDRAARALEPVAVPSAPLPARELAPTPPPAPVATAVPAAEAPPTVDRLGAYRMPRDVGPRPPDAAVEGEPIDVYADVRHLSIPERLQLFVQVCNAVAGAHRRGAIHGDLRAATIRVATHGTPKLTDVGTADLGATAADDIHALGVVLDQLLGGSGSNGQRRRLREELEAIVLTARGQAVGQRYGTVEELADAVRRYLDSPAARVRPDGAGAHGTTASSRRRAALAWTAAAVAVASLGIKVGELGVRRTRVAPPPPIETPPARQRVLVQDLADRIGDPRLVAALSDAFRAGLAESPSLQILPSRVRGAAIELTGAVDSAGGGFTITVQLTVGKTAGQPHELRETASDSAAVIAALGRLSERVRERAGEPAASVAASPRLEDVTSASLPALRAYASGARAIATGDRASGLRLLSSAVALDTGFASAHRLIAATYADLGDRRRSADALGHAIANQGRLPFYERHHTVASHATTVLANYAVAIDAYNRILDRYPNDLRALTNLGLAHAARREYAVQESLLVRAIGVDPTVPSLYTGLALAAVNQGEYDEARRALDRAEQRFPGARANAVAAMSLAASRLDWESAEREARARVGQAPGGDADALAGLEPLAEIVMAQGRLAEAQQTLRRVVASGTRGTAARSLQAAARLAYLELRYRHAPAAAVATMNAALARFPLARMDEGDRPYDEIARLYADAGQPARARELITQAERTRTGAGRSTDPDRRWTVGAIAMAEGRAWEGEIEIRGASETHPCPICALPALARAYEVAGKPDSAIATYERYLRLPWQRRYETDATELGFAMKRLGELYQQQNDRGKAAAQYAALLRLWRGADAELEPLLADVRRRLEQTGEATSR